MPDTLRLVTLSAGGRPIVVRDLEDGVSYHKARDSFEIIPPTRKPQQAAYPRRYGGSRTVGETHENGAIGWSALVVGTTADQAMTNIAAVVADQEFAQPGRYIEFGPDGGTRSTLFEVRGPGEWKPSYKWVQFAGAKSMVMGIKVPVAPVGLLLPMDIRDLFDADSITDYTFDAGAAGNVAVTGGVLDAVANLTTENRAYHSARGYNVGDGQFTKKFTPGATIASFKGGRFLKRIASNSYLECYVDDDATNSRLRIDVITAGVRVNRATVNLAARIADGVPFWVRGRIEGNVVYAEHFTADPTPMVAPTTQSPSGGAGYTLDATERTNFGSTVTGKAGWVWTPQHTNATADDYTDEPFTYRNLTLPEHIRLNGSIPGDAPALCDVTVTPSGGSVPPVFALLAWSQRPLGHSLVWNGDFEETGTDGWRVTASFVCVAATSITRVTAQKKFGTASGEIVTTATNLSGATFDIYRRFKKGVAYTISAWVRGTTTGEQVQIIIGQSGAGNTTGGAVVLTAAWQQITDTWVPTADAESAQVADRINDATPIATTFQVDGVQVYEGATAPTLGSHTEGAGGAPPFGVIEAESADTGDLTGWAVTADAGSRGGFRLYDATNSGAETYSAGWWIDPAALVADDFTLGEIDLEFWAIMTLHPSNISPKAILSARPAHGTSFGAERFTEWGTVGVNLVKPSVEARRPARLGAISFPVDRDRPARWKLWFAGSTAAGSAGTYGLDYLFCVPAYASALSPSAKPNDSTYPKFVTSVSETSKTIRNDLRGLTAKPPFPAQPSAGLGRAPLWLAPGDVDLFVKLSSLVPDDPTVSSGSEQLAHSGTVHVAVWPRVHLFKGT